MLCVIFFFQAEDGIRDTSVTGVQTCALPIYLLTFRPTMQAGLLAGRIAVQLRDDRSEERRVGKECRSRWCEDQSKKKIFRKQKRYMRTANKQYESVLDQQNYPTKKRCPVV